MCERLLTEKANGIRSVSLPVGAVCKQVRAPQCSSGIDCDQANENATKSSGNKTNIISHLITTWKAACDTSPETCGASADSTLDLPAFNEICSWTKGLTPLTDFTFMQLYHYLVDSKEKTFDKKSIEAFKSLKAYQYFADGLVRNVWTHHLQQKD